MIGRKPYNRKMEFITNIIKMKNSINIASTRAPFIFGQQQVPRLLSVRSKSNKINKSYTKYKKTKKNCLIHVKHRHQNIERKTS